MNNFENFLVLRNLQNTVLMRIDFLKIFIESYNYNSEIVFKNFIKKLMLKL